MLELCLVLLCLTREEESFSVDVAKHIYNLIFFVCLLWASFILSYLSSLLPVFRSLSCPVCHLPSPVSPAEDMAHSLVSLCLLQPPQGPRQYH